VAWYIVPNHGSSQEGIRKDYDFVSVEGENVGETKVKINSSEKTLSLSSLNPETRILPSHFN
jgi:hypothetical protein